MRRSIGALAALVLLATVPTAAAGAAATRAGREQTPLQFAHAGMSMWSYSVGSLTSCEVGDGAAVIKNTAAKPAQVTSVQVLTSPRGAVSHLHWGDEILSFRAGSTSGEVAGNFDLYALRNGHSLGPAIGRVLEPARRSHTWYDIVVRSKVPAGARANWHILGITVGYRIGSRTYVSRFKQSIILPPSKRCA